MLTDQQIAEMRALCERAFSDRWDDPAYHTALPQALDEIEQLAAEVRRLARDNAGLRKAEALLRAGLESQCELMDTMKQEVRGLRKELADADDCLRRIGLANHVQRAPWTELHP